MAISEAGAPHNSKLRGLLRLAVINAIYQSQLLRGIQLIAAGGYEIGRSSRRWFPQVKRRKLSKYVVLCYHRIGLDGVPLFSRLDPGVFEAQMRYIRRHYRVVSLKDMCAEMRIGATVAPSIVVTFDDGYGDLYRYAYPVLRKYQVPATIYLIGDCIEMGEVPWYDKVFAGLASAPGESIELDLDGPGIFRLGNHEERLRLGWNVVCYLRAIPDAGRRKWCELFFKRYPGQSDQLRARMLTWVQVREMAANGIFFGAHTMTHPAVSRLQPTEFTRELLQSRDILEDRLQTPVLDFAYPFGKPADQCTQVAEFLVRCGYRSAVTTIAGYNRRDTHPFRLRRVQIDHDDTMPAFAMTLARLFLESEQDVDSAQADNFEREPASPDSHERCEVATSHA